MTPPLQNAKERIILAMLRAGRPVRWARPTSTDTLANFQQFFNSIPHRDAFLGVLWRLPPGTALKALLVCASASVNG